MKKIYSVLSILLLAAFTVSCSNSVDEIENQEKGYLTLDVSANGTTLTRAAYESKTLDVTVTNSQNVTVGHATVKVNSENTSVVFDEGVDMHNKSTLVLAPGNYTIEAKSQGWENTMAGVDAAYYSGKSTVTIKANTHSTAKVTCTLANVKLTVEFSDEFKKSFASARSVITMPQNSQVSETYTMGVNKASSYFPVGDLDVTLYVKNLQNTDHSMTTSITDVQPRDHYIIRYTVAKTGNLGNVTVEVDPDTRTYIYTFDVPRKPGITLGVNAVNAWSTFAELSGSVTSKKEGFDKSGITLQYKKATDTDWTTVPNASLTITDEENNKISYKLTGLTPSTGYTYRLLYKNGEDEVNSAEANFTTEGQPALYNGGFEMWNKIGNVWFANGASDMKFWDSSNSGSAMLGEQYNVTTQSTETRPGSTGSSSAQLSSKYVANTKFAAASIFVGECVYTNTSLSNAYADLKWGHSFESRPTNLHGWMKYAPGSINRGSQPSGAPSKGEDDQCQIYCALTTGPLDVSNNKNAFTIPSATFWATDSRVVAYGSLPSSQCVNSDGWKEFDIPFEYHNLTQKPTHIIIVCSSSKYGDYFYGSDSSVLYLDDFELVYGDTPTVKQ